MSARLGVAAALITFGLSGAASATCPTAASAGRGFTLKSATDATTLRVRKTGEDEVSITTMRGGRDVGTTVYDRGLFPRYAIGPGGRSTFEYEGDVKGFELKVGRSLRFGSVLNAQDSSQRRSRVQLAVVGESTITIGSCTYPVFVIERANLYEGGGASLVLALFSADLGVPLRARSTALSGQVSETSYASIDLDGL